MFYYGEKVRLRAPEREDLPRFVSWLQNPEMRNYLTIRYISLAHEEKWFERLLTQTGGATPNRLHFVIETKEDPRPIGVISLESINWRDRKAEVGVFIGDPEYWGKGYGTDAMSVLLDVGFRWYNLHRIYLYVIASNARAIRSYEKAGFQHEGRMREAAYINGRFEDLLLLSILEQEYKK